MSDQCKHCLIRGDYAKCIKTECFHHENWINLQRIEIIKSQAAYIAKLEKLVEAVEYVDECHKDGEYKEYEVHWINGKCWTDYRDEVMK